MYDLRFLQKPLKVCIINSNLQWRLINRNKFSKSQMAKVGFELWKGPSSCFSTSYVPSIMPCSGNIRNKRKYGEGERDVYFCYHESTVFWCLHRCSHLDQRYKEQCFQRQKAQALGQTVRFSVKLVVFKVLILCFISTSQDPGRHTSNVLSGYSISIKHGKVRSYNNN